MLNKLRTAQLESFTTLRIFKIIASSRVILVRLSRTSNSRENQLKEPFALLSQHLLGPAVRVEVLRGLGSCSEGTTPGLCRGGEVPGLGGVLCEDLLNTC